MIHSLEICLKSFTVQDLSHSVRQIVGCCPKTWTLRLIPLPNHRRVFTVLRSPHIDKKSREQFQLITHKTKLEFAISSGSSSSADTGSRLEVLACLEAIKQLSSPGVQIQVQILASTAL
jgi:small subunit ribosomal protein S10